MKRQRFLKVGVNFRRVNVRGPMLGLSAYSDRGLAWLLSRFA